MRDPQRIARILALIEIVWNKYPDQRLGQLLSNISYREAEHRLWFIEDDQWEKYLLHEVSMLSGVKERGPNEKTISN